jgi:hypothetical protein
LQRELNIIDAALREIRNEKIWNDSERSKGTATLESLKQYDENTTSYKAVGTRSPEKNHPSFCIWILHLFFWFLNFFVPCSHFL